MHLISNHVVILESVINFDSFKHFRFWNLVEKTGCHQVPCFFKNSDSVVDIPMEVGNFFELDSHPSLKTHYFGISAPCSRVLFNHSYLTLELHFALFFEHLCKGIWLLILPNHES